MPNLQPAPLIWMSQKGREIIKKQEDRESAQRKKAKIHRCYKYEQLESFKEHNNSGRMKLESFERATRYFFNNSNVVLGELQERMFKDIKLALLGKMFKDDLVANLKYLRKRYQLDQLNDTLAIKLPRRSGKTEGMAIIVAIIMVSQPMGNCNMYNLTGTQAKEFLQSVMKQLLVFKDSSEFGWTMVRKDLRMLWEIRTKKYNSLNSVKSYACALKGNGKIGSRLSEKVLFSLVFFIVCVCVCVWLWIYKKELVVVGWWKKKKKRYETIFIKLLQLLLTIGRHQCRVGIS